jgi:toxin FitB
VSYLIDTNVISELRKGERADSGVASWFAQLADEDVFLSALTLGEIRRGIEGIRRRDPDSAAVLDRWLRSLAELHEDRILPVDRKVAEEWGRLNVPTPLPVVDGLLAATARIAGMTLATRNGSDFERTGVSCVNPFASHGA